MILIIDNYDSFVYNIYQYVGEFYKDITIRRNDHITIEEIGDLKPKAIIISPGPGTPSKAGICEEIIRTFKEEIPMLGVCLGHQAIGEVFGGKVIHGITPIHGKQTEISVDEENILFKGLPTKIQVGRYHSLVVEKDTLPQELQIIAMSEEGEIMGLKHRVFDLYGIQFHPESILTEYGKWMIRNFLMHIAKVEVKPVDLPVPNRENRILKGYLNQVINNQSLSILEAEEVMETIMNGSATSAQIGAFLTALRMKGETVEEITGFAKVMRQKANKVVHSEEVIDIVGTGGDLVGTFNISTTTAIVATAAGLKVAKHGNRSVSSRSGSADVLEALGVGIQLTPEQAGKCLEDIGICFMFAPCFHHAMKFAALPRREIGVRSVFNILGPLASPAQAEYMLLGVYSEDLLEVMGKVLMNLGIKKALIVHGEDGLDEVTLTGKTKICEVQQGKIIKYEISPEEYGLKSTDLQELIGGTVEENAAITQRILDGEKGAKRDIVVFNTAVALYSADKVESIKEGIILAQAVIDSGRAKQKLEQLIFISNGGGSHDS